MKLKTKLSLEKIQDADNVADLLKKEDLRVIGADVVDCFETDKHSRKRWETRMEDATKLALQLTEEKTYPWRNASNVKFPLLTIAALQFQARAYPTLVKAPDLVKYRVQGKDDGQKAARAARISAHMSYQLLEQDESWEEDHDKALLALPILGCVFKKSYYCPTKGHNRSKLVLPKNLVVHYYAKSIEDCERKTEIFELYPREVRERELRKLFIENDYGQPAIREYREEDERQGTTPPLDDADQPRVFLEQHRYLDLDGDGYKEPYVVTVERDSKKVARIVARIKSVTTEQSLKIADISKRIKALAQGVQPIENPTDEDLQQVYRVEQTIQNMQAEIEQLAAEKPKVLSMEPVEYFTKYPFIPSPDGGFYDIGFGLLLGSTTHSVNTIINQLIDSGTLQNSNTGFLGKGARIKGGAVRFQPGEWKRVNVAGSSLRDSIVPLPVNQPSAVLFNLLGLLINYAQQITSVSDTMMGENPGQNTPAYNMSAMLEQGLQVFNAIFKRVYRSQRQEFRKLYNLNSIYLDQEEYFSYQDSDSKILQVDYTADAKDLIPAADPNAFSNKEKVMKAQVVAERAMMVPGYDPIIVEKRLLESMDVPDAAEVYPLVPEVDENGQETGGMTLKFPPQPDPELDIKKAEEQRRTLESQTRSEVAYIEAEGKLMVQEADVMVKEAEVVLKLMQAQKLGADVETERLEVILKEIQDRRKAITEVAKLENQRRASSGVDRKSDN